MLYIKAICIHLFVSLLCIEALAQTDTCRLRISLLTCGPGQDLYSIWGHTGIRVIDSTSQTDVVFNYGTFDDSDPLFYAKFTRGIMMYSVTPFSFSDFMQEYTYYKRSVTEQVLHLTCKEKTTLVKALWTNAKNENRYYPYHFYADNCTSRARDIILTNIDSVHFADIRPAPTSTYRQLIHSYMNSNSQAWNRFGIDILLGNHLDEIMTNRQAMFLPDYLMKGLDSAVIRNRPLVGETNLLLKDEQGSINNFFTPVVLFSAVLVVMIILRLFNHSTAAKTLIFLDRLFFLCIGLMGLLMLILWTTRVDSVCRNNWNLLWALPSHVVIAFMISSRKKWVRYYWLVTALLGLLLLLAWKWIPQELNNSVAIIVAIVLFRSMDRYAAIKRL